MTTILQSEATAAVTKTHATFKSRNHSLRPVSGWPALVHICGVVHLLGELLRITGWNFASSTLLLRIRPQRFESSPPRPAAQFLCMSAGFFRYYLLTVPTHTSVMPDTLVI